jgi:hypothetical protein
MSNDVAPANRVESASEIDTNGDLFDDLGSDSDVDDDLRREDPVLEVTDLEKHYLEKRGLIQRLFSNDSEPSRVRAVDGYRSRSIEGKQSESSGSPAVASPPWLRRYSGSNNQRAVAPHSSGKISTSGSTSIGNGLPDRSSSSSRTRRRVSIPS